MKSNLKRKSVIMLVYEGKNKTEHNYFKHFNNRENKFRIEPVDSPETDIKGMADYAIKYAKKYDIKSAYGDKIFCIFDLDINKQKLEEYEQIRYNKKYKDINFIVSNPCFEIWFLFHFEEHPPRLPSSEKVKKHLCKYVKNYEENIDVYEKYNLKSLLSKALTYANNKKDSMKDKPLLDKNPYTQIPEVIYEFDKMNNI